MTDFVLHHSKNAPLTNYHEVNENFVNKVITYAEFLKQTLYLGMFVPCDEEGNALEEPVYSEPCSENQIGDYDELVYQYNLSKDCVLFEGFEIRQSFSDKILINDKNNKVMGSYIEGEFYFFSNYNTIEELVNIKLVLTKSATKKLGL